MAGWIKIHRDILDHWLYNEYRPLTKREAWENILIWAAYEDRKCMIKGQLIDCKRGQIIYSIETYASKFVWSASQVRGFFDLLKKDGMIKVEGLKYTTRLTVCNYDNYQETPRTERELPANCQRTAHELPANYSRTARELPATTEEVQEIQEEREIKKIREKGNFPKSEILKPFSELMKDNTVDLFADLEWQNRMLAHGCTARELSKYLTEFQNLQRANDDQGRETKELKKHFQNWLKIKIEKQTEKAKRDADKRKDRFNVPIPDYNAEAKPAQTGNQDK